MLKQMLHFLLVSMKSLIFNVISNTILNVKLFITITIIITPMCTIVQQRKKWLEVLSFIYCLAGSRIYVKTNVALFIC